jgi:serine/threonine protein kinase
MAPEYLLGGEFSARTDVYALGVLSYQLLTGRLPLAAPNLRAQVAMTLEARPEPPRRLRPELDADVEALLLQCLGKDPAARPADASELLQRWMRLLGGAPDPGPVLGLLAAGQPESGPEPA